MFAFLMATTKGDAEALVPALVACRSLGSLWGTSMPRKKTLRQ